MAGDNSESFANRDAPIPVVQVQHASNDGTPTETKGKSRRLSASKLKHKLEHLGENIKGDSSNRMGDKMMNMLLAQVLPSEDLSDNSSPGTPTPSGTTPHIKDRRSRAYVERPSFSIPTMSSNFRRFNSRIGVAFIFQNRLIRLFTWAQPTQTLSFLFVWTFICINPYLLPVLPLASGMFFVMVPSYLTRHPEPVGNPMEVDADLWRGSLSGPPLADAKTIKPAPEFSKDFFRNMRDLQNCMEDFSRGHDAVLSFITPLTNFSNENLSSMLYLILLVVSVLLFITAHLLPWRAIILVLGYIMTALGHPAIQELIATPETEKFLTEAEQQSRTFLLTISRADIELETSQETREVEIFELQYRALHDQDGEYEGFIFSPSPYSPLSPSRISGDRPRGTPFFEDVLPPRGWRWSDKKWTLDLLSREWVEDRCVTGVEVEVEGERWVTDLHYEVLETADEKAKLKKRGSSKGGSKDIGDQEREVLRRAWEDSKPSRKGEWRRRRWVRGVERMPWRDGQS
ncbi:Pex24p-domain-containing protein [Pyrenophora tritici-repentis]|uniref:Pex24p-domain-containing protein n=1 Tax=Pyrenophora tritici-repentis TaxID=45151 RepID=A0A2W1DKI1_9PLEO|nr:Pex24p-domain-containing protein [Pyrenophora tritici-repentis]KAF7450989.1 Pex24p-domain-containing protein [Pyrenophora tritici-repentis]KAF7573669.1 Pex24p domain containing protein [Pyrenophora tritici-repentis]KAG9380797.1 Pex24p-domain-containing protein [Pyrenophora tritici-repentis]KAI0582860.1 Pex24p-domain-containing protein [Pyrenophora tritici-repentis]